jgi:hypothetical protein
MEKKWKVMHKEHGDAATPLLVSILTGYSNNLVEIKNHEVQKNNDMNSCRSCVLPKLSQAGCHCVCLQCLKAQL